MTSQIQHHSRPTVDIRIPAIDKYAYCLCLHVKPTTIFIAVFKLIRALLFASLLLNSEFTYNEQGTDMGLVGMEDRPRHMNTPWNLLLRIIMASVSAVGIYAVISGRAALLMPLYAVLLVEFFFTLPAFYNRDLDQSFTDGLSDFKTYPPTNNQRYSFMLLSVAATIVRIYFLCVIWKCYRYLRLIELVSPIHLSEIYPHIHTHPSQGYPVVRVLNSTDSTDLGSGHNMAPPPYESIASNMKPPNYEEAMKTTTTPTTLALSPLPAPLAINPATLARQQQSPQDYSGATVVFDNPAALHIMQPNENVSIQVISGNPASRTPTLTDVEAGADVVGGASPPDVAQNSATTSIHNTATSSSNQHS